VAYYEEVNKLLSLCLECYLTNTGGRECVGDNLDCSRGAQRERGKTTVLGQTAADLEFPLM
jgi:hypothetical protein